MVSKSCRVGFVLGCGAQLLLQTAAFSTSHNACCVPRSRNNNSRRSNAAVTVVAATPTSDVDLLPEIRDEIIERGLELRAWEDCARILSDLFAGSSSSSSDNNNNNEEEAELYLADAFRWKAWASASAMMRKYQRPVLPDANKLREGIDWLKEGPLGMTDDQVRNNIRQHPGIYLREPNAMYKKVLGSAPRKYRDDEVLKRFIEDDPNVLQVTYNCDGEGCQSECGSCWVAYESRLPSIPEF